MAVREARGLARLDARFEPLAERLAGLEAELDDVALEIRGLADGGRARSGRPRRARGAARHDLSPSNAATATARPAVIAHGERAAAELERLRGLDAERARREREDAALLDRGRGRGGDPVGPPGARPAPR